MHSVYIPLSLIPEQGSIWYCPIRYVHNFQGTITKQNPSSLINQLAMDFACVFTAIRLAFNHCSSAKENARWEVPIENIDFKFFQESFPSTTPTKT